MRTSVLVIEDDTNAQAILSVLLGGKLALTFASTLREGIESLKLGSPDVVLLDLGLPDSSFHETLARVKAVRGRSAIVVISQHDDPKFISDTIAATADAYVRKGKDDMDATVLLGHIFSAITSHERCMGCQSRANRFDSQ